MTKEHYQDPNTPMIEKFFFYYTLNGGVLTTLDSFQRYFMMWINVPIVQAHYPVKIIRNRVINALNIHFKI